MNTLILGRCHTGHQLLVVVCEDGEARARDEVVVEAAGHLRHRQDGEYLLIERPAHWTVETRADGHD